MLITINKIVDVKIPNPIEGKDPIIKEEVFEESIDVWAIKSIRKFSKDEDKSTHKDIQGDISVMYLHGESKGKRSPSIHVLGARKDLEKEVNDLRGRAQKNS